jgi:hypothetical protein
VARRLALCLMRSDRLSSRVFAATSLAARHKGIGSGLREAVVDSKSATWLNAQHP